MEHGGAAAESVMSECAARAVRVARIAHIVERGAKQVKTVAESQRVHEWNMPRARSASVRSVMQNKNLRNIRKTVRGSMRRVHVKTGMLQNWHFIGKC
jgi:hypothetical protein